MRNTTAALLILAVSLMVYANSFRNAFHFDDQHYVVENPYIRDLGNIPSFFESPRFSSFEKDFTAHYRPLVVTSFALNYAWGGLRPAGYHLVNLLFHIGSAFCIYLILYHLLTSTRSPVPVFPALAAGLIFAVHPFNAEVVNYITARSSVMCAFFYLLAFWCWMKYRGPSTALPNSPPARGERRGRPDVVWHIASLFAFLAAMLSKEIAVTLPVMLWLYDRYFLKIPRSKSRLSGRIFPYLPFFLLVAVPYLLVRYFHYGAAVPLEFNRDFWNNLTVQLIVLAENLKLLLIPVGLTIDHDIPPVTAVSGPRFVLSGIVILALWGTAYFLRRYPSRGRIVSFFIVWFFIVLLPTTIIPLNAILQENRGYLAGVGFAVFLGILLALPGEKKQRTAWGILALLLLVYSLTTQERNRVWKDDLTLWSDAVVKAPGSARARDNLGLAFFNRGEMQNAEREFLETLRINPAYFYAYYNLGVVYQSQGKLEEAIHRYRQAVNHQPDFFRAYYNLGLACKQAGRLDEAVEYYRRAIEVDSRYSFVYNNLGVVYYEKKEYAEAETLFKAAVQKDPAYAKAYYNLGNVYYEEGAYRKAFEMYRFTLKIDPTFEKARSALSRVAEREGFSPKDRTDAQR